MDLIELVSKDEVLDIYNKNIARFAEANGAELDYTDEVSYSDSVNEWYSKYLKEQAEKANAAGKYDEYFDVINSFVLQVLNKIYFNNNKAYISEDVPIYAPNASREDEPVGYTEYARGKLHIVINKEILSTKGKPFIGPGEDGIFVKKYPLLVDNLLDAAKYGIYGRSDNNMEIMPPLSVEWGGEQE